MLLQTGFSACERTSGPIILARTEHILRPVVAPLGSNDEPASQVKLVGIVYHGAVHYAQWTSCDNNIKYVWGCKIVSYSYELLNYMHYHCTM